ncbi:uncharacterized protein [Branchiostoma lanceolatum]|uniref:uncharacterized protein n=1 Tax=Branchiostoma lanceolatum TaxID=7740 RepID=UPI0034562195
MLLPVSVLLCVLTTLAASVSDKPCGEFPWPSDDYTVNCDYRYSRPSYYDVVPQGRCQVRCPPDSEVLVGPPADGNQGLTDGFYYCNMVNGTWLGTEPVCLGFYNNVTMVTDESKGIRLVGGASYGCVELYDNITQQWGPVRGWVLDNFDPIDHAQMEWANLACRNLRFSSGLATKAYVRREWFEDDMWPLEENYELYPLQYHYEPRYPPTVPKFVVSKSPAPQREGATLHDAIGRVVRGPCSEGDRDCGDNAFGLCLACEGQQGTILSTSISIYPFSGSSVSDANV